MDIHLTHHGGYERDALPEGRDESVGECDGGQPRVQREVGERRAQREHQAPTEHGAAVPDILLVAIWIKTEGYFWQMVGGHLAGQRGVRNLRQQMATDQLSKIILCYDA